MVLTYSKEMRCITPLVERIKERVVLQLESGQNKGVKTRMSVEQSLSVFTS